MDIFEKAFEVCGEAKEVSNWIMVEVLRMATETATDVEDIAFDAANLGKLINLVKAKVINRGTAKDVFEKMFTENVDPEKYVKENGLEMMNDDGAVLAIVKSVIENNPKAVGEFKGGSQKVKAFLVGQCMKQLKGKADPATVNVLMAEELEKV